MSRIYCKTPSTGYIVNYVIPKASLTTSFITLAEAPDFSVPDSQNNYTNDPRDSTRGIRPGEVFFLTPIFARNNSTVTQWIEVQLVLESGVIIGCPGKILIPAGDTSLVPVQGRSLLKRLVNSTYGDRLQIKAQSTGVIDIWASGEVKLSAEHTQLSTGSASL